jgi:protein-tyrosine phosphatase
MYRITECLSVGPFASAERAPQLLSAGVTHILNVSHGPSHLSAADGFVDVAWVSMRDSHRLPASTVVRTLDALHEMASQPGAHVYVHCVMGQVRSPAVLWLYLIALGVPPDDARDWIEDRAPSAVAGHSRIVDREHVLLAQQHGLTRFFPHPRPNLIVPFPRAEDATE